MPKTTESPLTTPQNWPLIQIYRGYLFLTPNPVLRPHTAYNSDRDFQKEPDFLEQLPDIALEEGCELYIPAGEKGSDAPKHQLESLIQAFKDHTAPDITGFDFGGILSAPDILPQIISLCQDQRDALIICRPHGQAQPY